MEDHSLKNKSVSFLKGKKVAPILKSQKWQKNIQLEMPGRKIYRIKLYVKVENWR